MTWYWWLIGGYYGIPALVSFFVVILVIREEVDRNLLSRNTDYWGFIKDCGTCLAGGIAFCLVFLPLIIEPYLKKREVREMKRFLELSGWIILLLVVLSLLATLPAERIIFVFLGYYLLYGMVLGLKYEKVDEMCLAPDAILTMLWGIIWPFLLIDVVVDFWVESFGAGLKMPFI